MIARLMFVGMWNFADDLGRLPLSAKTIKAQIFPSDDITSESILGMVSELSANGLILTYEVDGRQYVQITGWQHQRIDKPQPGKCPAPVNGYSENVRGMVATEGKGKEGKVEERNSEADASGAEAPIDHNLGYPPGPGHIALQVHHVGVHKVEFRKVEVMPLAD